MRDSDFVILDFSDDEQDADPYLLYNTIIDMYIKIMLPLGHCLKA